MNLSPAGDFFIKNLEAPNGIPCLTSYQDGGGVWTIGWGSTGPDIGKGLTWSVYQCQLRFANDVAWAVAAVNKYVTAPLSQAQFDALVAFCFNIGQKAFSGSTMVKLLNAGKYQEAALQFPRWNKDNGKVVEGLTNRRMREQKMFLAGTK